MKRALSAGLALLLCSAAHAQTIRFGVVLGNNQGHDPGRTLRFAEADARKVYGVLSELGDIPEENLHLLLGATADEAWQVIREVERRIGEIAGRPGVQALLVLYYSGHAEGDVLELGASSLQFDELSAFLKSSRAGIRLAFIDSCMSGKLVATKGGRRGQAYDIRVADEIAASGYAVITSSADNELSQESAEIRGSFFTHYLVSALRGAGDGSLDGKVTLSEAYRYAYGRTVARTSVTVGGGQHPMYDFNLSGRGEIMLTRTASAPSHLEVESPADARLVILDDRLDRVVMEADAPASRAVRVVLPPGRYQVVLLGTGSVQSARAELAAGRGVRLTASDFEHRALEQAVSKGGLFRTRWPQRLGAGFVLRRMPLEGVDVALGAALVYRLQTTSGWQPTARLTWSTAADTGLSTGFFDLGAGLGAGYAWPVGVTWMRVELLASYEHFFQDDAEGERRHTSGFGYLGLFGIEVPLGPVFFGLDLGAGGRVFQLRDAGWVHRLDLQLFLGFGWKWNQ